MSWFTRNGAAKKPSKDDVRSIVQRLDNLEDDVLQLTHRFVRLQGTVTGALRKMQRELDTAAVDEEPDYDGE